MLSARARRRRRAFTLAELVVATVLLGVVSVTVVSVVARQQRLFRGTLEALDARGQLRQGAAVVEGLLRGIAPNSGDILSMSDSALEFVATIGAAVACVVPGGAAAAVEVPAPDPSGPGLSSWLSAPQPGDLLLLHDERAGHPAAADTVRAFRITDAVPRSDVCAGGPLAGRAGARDGWRLTLDTVLPDGVAAAAHARLGRRMRLSFYRSPTDGRWYLGLREWGGGSAQAVQPVSGPYRQPGRGASARPGVGFRYADEHAAPVDDPARAGDVARIDVVLRAPDREASSAGARATDSLLVRVALRNRRRGAAPAGDGDP